MFSQFTLIFVFTMAAVMVLAVVGAFFWAIIHIARGKFHEEYQVATLEGQKSQKQMQKEQ